MKDVLKDLDIPERALSVRGALAEISRAKDKLTTPEDFEAGAGDDFRLKKVAQAYRVYQRRLADADAMVRAVAGFYRVHLRSLGDARYTLE